MTDREKASTIDPMTTTHPATVLRTVSDIRTRAALIAESDVEASEYLDSVATFIVEAAAENDLTVSMIRVIASESRDAVRKVFETDRGILLVTEAADLLDHLADVFEKVPADAIPDDPFEGLS